MINVGCVIYCDALSLLFNDKANLKEDVKAQLLQSDYELDCIRMELEEEYLDEFSECDIDTLMEYISVDEEGTTFDYGESATCGDLRCVAFNVPISFDDDRFKEEINKM